MMKVAVLGAGYVVKQMIDEVHSDGGKLQKLNPMEQAL